MVTQMAKFIDTVYVSGWQSSSTASSTDEPGPDLADYPYVRQWRPLCFISRYAKLRVDNRPEQGRPPLDGSALPRQEAT